MAALAGLIAVTHAQTAVSTAASSASRLSQMALDPVPDASATAAYTPTSSSRLGGMLLAQIPQQPSIRPGQNPNTVPPGGRGIGPGGSMHIPNRVLPGSNGGRVPNGSPNSAAQSAGGATDPTGAPLSVSGRPASAPAGSPAPPPQPAMAVQPQAVPAEPVVDPVQQAAAPAEVIDDGEMVEVVFQAAPLPSILDKYSDWTGKKIIRDMNVEAVTFTIDSHGALPKRKAIDFLERSLLLNGYGFIPAGEDFVKILNLAAIKPGAEHPLIMKAEDLPENGEAIVTYIEPLQYIEPDDLKKTLSELVQLHAYGVVTPLPNARGVAITENSNTIRYIIALLKDLDKAPVTTEQRSFQLTRASVDDVAKALADILDIEGKGSGGSSGGKKSSSGGTTPSPVPNAVPGQPGAVPQQGAARTGVYGSAPQASANPPKLIPIPRTNKLLVIARPSDLDYIATLITELDGAAELRSFMTRPLKYLAATEILPIIKDAITRGEDEGGSGGSSSGGSIIGNNKNQNANKTGDFGTNNRSGSNNSFGSNNGSGGFGSSGGSSMGSGGGGLQALRQGTTPQSLVVGKSLLIADPVANTIFASGPPEHLRVLTELLDELDKRPRSVVLSVVIGQLKLDDNKDFGIDYIFRPNEIRAGKYTANVAGTAVNRVGAGQGILDPNAITGLADLAKSAASGIQFFGTINDQVTLALSALASNSNFKILSRPTLYTMNNQPASIETGLKIPVPVSSLSSFNTTADPNQGGTSNGFVSNIQYQDVQLRLDVSPLINSDDELTLQVKQVNADVAGSTVLNGNSIPNISNQGLETTIMVKNNSTVLLGGLIQETTDKQRSGIPILKDIPLIKYLASSTKDYKTRRELLVFIQPRIVTGDGDQPVGAMDTAGASPLGDDARKFMNHERSDPATDVKTVRRNKVSSILHKLFE